MIYPGCIYDTMQYVKPDVSGFVGNGASMAALLLTAGTKGKRYTLPYSRIMIHQPLGRPGTGKDIEIQARDSAVETDWK